MRQENLRRSLRKKKFQELNALRAEGRAAEWNAHIRYLESGSIPLQRAQDTSSAKYTGTVATAVGRERIQTGNGKNNSLDIPVSPKEVERQRGRKITKKRLNH